MSLGLTRRLEACSIRFLVYRWSSSVTSRNFPLLISTQIPSQSQASFEQLILVYTKGTSRRQFIVERKTSKLGAIKGPRLVTVCFSQREALFPQRWCFISCINSISRSSHEWRLDWLPLSFLVLGLATWDAWFMLRRHENTCDASKRDG